MNHAAPEHCTDGRLCTRPAKSACRTKTISLFVRTLCQSLPPPTLKRASTVNHLIRWRDGELHRTVVDIRYLGVRAGSGASIATLRLASSAIAKAHEWARHESPCRDRGVCASLKGWGRRLAKPQRQAGALTADVLAVIRLTAVQPRKRGRGHETEEQAPQRGKFDVALVAVLSDAGLRRSEAAALTWGDVQRWDDGSGRITVIRSKTDVEAAGAVVAVIPAAMRALDAIRPVGLGGAVKVFGLSESQIARRVKAIAKAAALADWELFSGHSGRVGMAQNGAPTHEIERQGRWKQGGGMVGRYTRGESAGSALRYL